MAKENDTSHDEWEEHVKNADMDNIEYLENFEMPELEGILNDIYAEEPVEGNDSLIPLDISQIEIPPLDIPELDMTGSNESAGSYLKHLQVWIDPADGKLKVYDENNNIVELKTSDGKSIKLAKPKNSSSEASNKKDDENDGKNKVDSRFDILDL